MLTSTRGDLRAVALWRSLGRALQASASPRPGGLDLAGSVPAIHASTPPTRVTLSLAWAGLTRPPAIAHPMGGGMVGAHVDTPAPTMRLLNGAVSRI